MRLERHPKNKGKKKNSLDRSSFRNAVRAARDFPIAANPSVPRKFPAAGISCTTTPKQELAISHLALQNKQQQSTANHKPLQKQNKNSTYNGA
jgi:hypothetical protein